MTAITPRTPRLHIPNLGPRGEGWVALQAVLFVAVVATGLAGPTWAGSPRMIGALVGIALITGGVALIGGGIVGLRRQLTAFPRPVADGRLIDDGAFGVVRHPMYGGGLLFALGWGLLTASMATLACAFLLALFFDLKSRREEAWLAEALPDYADYRRRTPRLVPWIY
jgi:protein-S-isoprenylcysteine O-methyltransferase Ste14